jgi:SAM-dependent methyltransferase
MASGTTTNRTADVRIETIFDELAAIRRADPSCADLAQFRSAVTAEQYRRFYRTVERTFRPGSELLDWGCGNGHASYGLTRLGYRVTGYSFEPCNLAPHCGDGYRFVRGDERDPSRLPFDDGSFDGVVSVGVLEHVRETGGDEVASLLEIARVLRPGGRFVCYHLPNRYSVIEAISSRLGAEYNHPYRYRASDIRRLCQRAGLELLETRRYGALPRNAWHRAPAPIRDSRGLARAWNLLDDALGLPLRPVCQNHLFVAGRPG